MVTCDCGRTFSDPSAITQHQKAKGCCSCKSCGRSFLTVQGLEQHTLAPHPWDCKDCDKAFLKQKNLKSHQRVTGHCYCIDCNRFFVDNSALGQHLRSSLHASQFHCCDCDQDFINEQALQQHLNNEIHSVTQRPTSDYVCNECKREFGTEQALKQHQVSLVHRPLSDIKCVTSGSHGGCQRRFSSPSALLHHLESGACKSGVTRKTLNAAVQVNDTSTIITNTSSGKNFMFLDPLSPTSSNSGAYTATDSNGGVELTPSSTTRSPASSALLTPSSDQSFDLSLTLLSFRKCPFCPPNRAAFSSSQALQQHLSSPADEAPIFHCPTALFVDLPSTCAVVMKSFSTLSGLAQHLESGACGGPAMIRRVAGYIEVKLMELGMGKVKLLK